MWQLPVVFICENNQYMEYTPIESVTAVNGPPPTGPPPTGSTPVVVDGNDVEAVYAMARRAHRAGPGTAAARR